MKIRVGILTAPKIEVERREHTFIVHNVRIGIGFHWQQFENEEFEGELEIVSNPDGTQTAVNIIDLEDYLTSVISSEMSADAPLELLKAQAVIARSWVLRAIGHTSHTTFDVCADDHCQRYYGIARRNARAIEAVHATCGQVLTTLNWKTTLNSTLSTLNLSTICDCRYHKCCGGKTEVFETCWEGEHHPYLESVECPYCNLAAQRSASEAVCQPEGRSSLNSFDRSKDNYHNWTVTYTAEELAAIFKQKTGLDFGSVLELRPLQRGVSGRINRLEVVGSKRTEILSGELTIRQALSPSTLYSSWFDIETFNSKLNNETASLHSKLAQRASTLNFKFRGHGWGHGVGLCQMGAAEMAKQ
ncbi:MAG: SpoIID/LytB domain-containing protein, partial [Paludibacteraceae bacterium]|nr:SpoIID/LytB domain-containing protein [Paludibacteraceae bacterium]